MEKTKRGETCWMALKQLLSLEEVTCAATLVPPVPNPVASLTTATNCELAGKLIGKVVDVESPVKEWSMILRTSVLFGKGVGPNGMTRTRYGGCPSEPVMLIDTFEHC